MDLLLNGSTVAIAGASRGLGLRLAQSYLREGATVRICGRSVDDLTAAEVSLSSLGDVRGAQVDVSDANALRAWLDSVWRETGGLDIFVANASALTTDNSEASWAASYATDFSHVVNSFELLAPRMAERGHGSLIAISSVSGLASRQPVEVRPYATMKAAIVSYTAQVAQQYAGAGVRVNAVSPGSIMFENGFWDHIRSAMPDVYEGARDAHPVGRMATLDEVADVVIFVSSPRAAFVTGTNVRVDGGYTQHPNF